MDQTIWDQKSKEGKDLIQKMLVVDPDKRISAQDVLNHDWFKKTHSLVFEDHFFSNLQKLEKKN